MLLDLISDQEVDPDSKNILEEPTKSVGAAAMPLTLADLSAVAALDPFWLCSKGIIHCLGRPLHPSQTQSNSSSISIKNLLLCLS